MITTGDCIIEVLKMNYCQLDPNCFNHYDKDTAHGWQHGVQVIIIWCYYQNVFSYPVVHISSNFFTKGIYVLCIDTTETLIHWQAQTIYGQRRLDHKYMPKYGLPYTEYMDVLVS